MSRYELSLNKEYVKGWGINEALREIFQNAIDNGNYSYDYSNYNESLEIVSQDTSLDKSTLLLGTSTKNSSHIGQFGEGYKLACLVLVRDNYDVIIENGPENEVWIPKIVKSRRYGTDILVFDISRNKLNHNNLIFRIEGLSDNDIEEYKSLNLNLIDNIDKRETEYGDLILNSDMKGKLFVEGLYVCNDDNLLYGYNFKSKDVQLNRDRDQISSFDTHWQTSKIWSILLSNEELFNKDNFDELMKSPDVCYISRFTLNDNRKIILELFRKLYGDNAYPVDNNDLKELAIKNHYEPIYISSVVTELIADSIDSNLDVEENKKQELSEEFDDLMNRIIESLNDNELIDELKEFIDNHIIIIEE